MSDAFRPPDPGDSSPEIEGFGEASDPGGVAPWMPRPSDSAVDLLAEAADTNNRDEALESEDDEVVGPLLREPPPRPPTAETKIIPPEQLPPAASFEAAVTSQGKPAPVAGGQPATAAAARSTRESVMRSRRDHLLILLLTSYASAVTLGLVALLMSHRGGTAHELESLPDIKPLEENEFRFAPQKMDMPPGHTLELGQSVRFGNIRVEPLRVTRGPVEFVHFTGGNEKRPASAPVLKLWLQLTNESTDQLIAPLDAILMLTRSYQSESDTLLTNNFVRSQDAEDSQAEPLPILDHPQTSEWDLKDQQLGHRLKPGESMVTYIPTQPLEGRVLEGPLFWRMHFRKGYHDPSGHGVTTLIEVALDASQIEAEASGTGA